MPMIVILLVQIVNAYGDHHYPQCNVGSKLFSLEISKAICAPLVEHTCIRQCEWKPSCKKASHWHAFGGRRTFVAGLVVSPNQLILCCASLATVTFQGEDNMEMCEWRNEEYISKEGASIRLDPVMQQYEYIRDLALKDRQSNGVIEVRIEVCTFLTERKHCDFKEMNSKSAKQWKLLLLRLSRGNFLKE
uniref:Apple domain-containing protein n=1 Tax=Ascaris lumbricoides TaxID=6252 RepID=A0A0M3I6U8_ASCLU